MAFSVGETLQNGKYHLHALLDQHAWGMTFLATHEGVEQQVVIKTFQAASAGPSPLQIASYIDYAKKLRRFHHPHLPRVISIFEERDQACMVSEFVQGIPFSQLINDQPLEEEIALTYIRQISQGLHALHRHGLLHLNLSPSRILKRQGDGQSIILGLNSRFASQEAQRQQNPYLSFEQHKTPAIPSLASEIYGISAILYHFVTGQAPVPACDRTQTALIPPRQIRPELSQSIEEVILAGMALAPSDRPQRIKEWVKRLPAPPKADATTKLQIPSAWQVKLPAFHEAGMTTAVSATITPQSSEKTTLQQPKPIRDQSTAVHGHDDHKSASTSPISQPETTTQTPTLTESVVTASSTPPPMQTDEHQSKVEEPSSDHPSGTIFMPANRRRPSRHTHRFPKWALFWCALVAAGGGLGAGLWLRMNLTRQFAMPSKPTEASPIDQLKTLKTKQEEFLPTQNSVIPGENDDTTGVYEFDTEAEADNNATSESNPEIETQDTVTDDSWRQTESWRQGLEEQPVFDNQPSYETDPYTDTYTDPTPDVSDSFADPSVDPLGPTFENPVRQDASDSFVSDPSLDSGLDDDYRSATIDANRVDAIGDEGYRSDVNVYNPDLDTYQTDGT